MLLSAHLFNRNVRVENPRAAITFSVPRNAKGTTGWVVSRVCGWRLAPTAEAPEGFPLRVKTRKGVEAAVAAFGYDVVRDVVARSSADIGAARAFKRGMVWFVVGYVPAATKSSSEPTVADWAAAMGSGVCGAPTKDGGKPCRRRTGGGRCYQHA